jgi:hypothetical protein
MGDGPVVGPGIGEPTQGGGGVELAAAVAATNFLIVTLQHVYLYIKMLHVLIVDVATLKK